VVRPGHSVVVVNIGCYGALVESTRRLRPGVRTELQLSRTDVRSAVAGHIARSQVARLNPILYRTVIVFDAGLEMPAQID